MNRRLTAGLLFLVSPFSVAARSQDGLRNGHDKGLQNDGTKSRTVSDAVSQLSLNLGAEWILSHEDGELSTFHLDARTAPASTHMRTVAQLGENPYPQSTFSGALFYVSMTRPSTLEACNAQATAKPNVAAGSAIIGDRTFVRGFREAGKICTEERDTVYTALRHGSCVRFDLVIHTFCGGEVSGARDMTANQLQEMERRLEGILQTVRWTAP